MTLYLKYRSQTLDELDIDSVRESLEKIVAKGNLPHAFLFAGPKGTGKTSAARIIAKIVNCEKGGKEPCNKCDQCLSIAAGNNLDVQELDAASNRGIDDIRTLRDNVKLAPAKAKKKIYIIDEAHMLTTEASNALLKTLEEPPEHVMFILATTNPEKLIETIRSRATLINFTKATVTEIERSLTRVIKGEKLKIESEVVQQIAAAAKGSFRDATKLLEQVVSEGEGFLTKNKSFSVTEFLTSLAKRQAKAAINLIEESVQKGVDAESLTETVLSRLRLGLLTKVGVGEEDLPAFTKDELICLVELFSQASVQIPSAPIEQLPLELAVIKWCGEGGDQVKEELDLKKGEPAPVKEVKETQKADEVKEEKKELKMQLKEIGDDVWKNILAQIRPLNASIEGLLRAAKPLGFDGKTLILGVYYKFHKERLEENCHRRILEDVVANILGGPVRVSCTLTEPPPRPVTPEVTTPPAVLTEPNNNDIIKVAEEIFGN